MMTAGFGIERLGLLALRFPRAMLLALAAILPLALYGASQVTFSSDVREIFRSAAPEFESLERLAQQFPETERDALLVVEGKDLFTPETLARLRDLHLELSLEPDVRHVLSIFSAREAPDDGGVPASLFPDDLTAGVDMAELRRRVLAHPLVEQKLLSDDASLALIVVALDRQGDDGAHSAETVAAIARLAEEILAGSGLDISMTGLAVMRVEIIDTLIRDQRTFIGAGVVIGLSLFWLMFRRALFALIAGAPAGMAIVWLLGAMHLMGQEVNVLTNVVPVIVMVLVFCDALHLLFATRTNLEAGRPLDEAVGQAVREVGPACVLTSITTMLALLTMALTSPPFIARFGVTAAIGCGLALLATLSAIPALCVLTMRRERWVEGARRRDPVRRAIDRLCAGAATLALGRPRLIAGAGIAATVLAAALYAANAPSYRYSENLPRDNAAFHAIERIEAKLAGPNAVRVLIEWPPEHAMASRETLDVVGAVHRLLEAEPLFKSVSSLHSVARWAGAGEPRSPASLFDLLDGTALGQRFYSEAARSALVTAYFGDLDASELAPVLNRLERELATVERDHPGATVTMTGIVPLSARASTEMIRDLNRSLLSAIAVIIVLIGLALRSITAGLVSILPNLLPIAMGGAYLYLAGKGLQFTSVVAFTIGFGIAVDSTIHILNRYRLERGRGRGVEAALRDTLVLVGPAVVVSAIVLACGMAITLVSEMPMLQLFGTVCVVVFATALIGDMLFLPAFLCAVGGWWRQPGRGFGWQTPAAATVGAKESVPMAGGKDRRKASR